MESFNKVSKVINNELIFLKKYDFYYDKEEIKKSNFFGDRLMIEYQSNSIDRKIRIYYSEKPIEKFSIFLDSSKNDGFLLSDYLSEKEDHTILNSLSNSNPREDLESFSRRSCLTLKYICENYIQDILLGKEWPGKPFDWTPYK